MIDSVGCIPARPAGRPAAQAEAATQIARAIVTPDVSRHGRALPQAPHAHAHTLHPDRHQHPRWKKRANDRAAAAAAAAERQNVTNKYRAKIAKS